MTSWLGSTATEKRMRFQTLAIDAWPPSASAPFRHSGIVASCSLLFVSHRSYCQAGLAALNDRSFSFLAVTKRG